MADEQQLSQEEIDALLNQGGEDGARVRDGTDARIRPYDPATQHRVIRERLHTLDIINERFARQFRVSLFNLIRRSADITVESVRYQTFEDFARNVPVPANLNLIAMKPLRGTALVMFPSNLVFMVVDNLFGGDGRFVSKAEGREFTHTEQRIIRRLLDLALQAYQNSWQSVYALEVSYLRSELQAKFANITNSPNEIIVTTTFQLEVGNLASKFQICIPYSMIEPLRDLLTNPVADRRDSGDRTWTLRMAGELKQSEVELVAELATVRGRVADIMKLEVDTVLPIELPETVTARVQEVPVMECEYGSRAGQRALRIVRLFNHAAAPAGAAATPPAPDPGVPQAEEFDHE